MGFSGGKFATCYHQFRTLKTKCSLPNYSECMKQSIFIAGRPKAALLFWFFGDFRCGALLFIIIHVIYKYKNR